MSKQLSLSERIVIERMLSQDYTFASKAIMIAFISTDASETESVWTTPHLMNAMAIVVNIALLLYKRTVRKIMLTILPTEQMLLIIKLYKPLIPVFVKHLKN